MNKKIAAILLTLAMVLSACACSKDTDSTRTRWIKQGGVCVTTYETTNLFTELDEYNIDLLVVDEAHYIKNPTAIRTKSADLHGFDTLQF